MKKKDNFGRRSNSNLAASGPIKSGTTNANLGGKAVTSRSNITAQNPNLGKLVFTTIIEDLPKFSINGEGAQVAIYYTTLQIPKINVLTYPLVAGIQVSLLSGSVSQLLTLTSTLSVDDTFISVSSFNPNFDIGKGALICIDQEDLFNQYQNKTKGTVAGFTIDADGIAKSGIEITDWLNSNTMSGASVNNVPTALSVKNYVDNSHPAEDQTLQEVTDNGNTTTNAITFAGGTSTGDLLIRKSGEASIKVIETTNNNFLQIYQQSNFSYIIAGKSSGTPTQSLLFYTGGSEKIRLNPNGNLLLGTTTDNGNKLNVVGSSSFSGNVKLITGSHLFFDGGTNATYIVEDIADRLRFFVGGSEFARFTEGTNDTIIFFKNASFGGTISSGAATFSGQVTIPATPVATTDAASKSYVDGKAGLNESLQDVTNNGDTTTNKISLTNNHFQLSDAYSLRWGADFNNRIYNQTSNTIFLNNGSERMRITSTGNVLIGTTTDSGRRLIIGNLNGAVNKQISLLDGGGTEQATISVETTTANDLLVATKASFRLFTGSTIGGITSLPTNERIRVTTVGNVLIGTTTNSGRKLSINGNAELLNSNELRFYNTGNTNWGQIKSPSSGIMEISTGGGIAMTLLGNGNVLIGTTTDDGSNKLQVNGGIKSSSFVTADTYFQSSDASAVLTTTGAGAVFLRPNGFGSGTGALKVSTTATTITTPLTGTTATFTGQVTIPATPVATTDAASKGYVDAQVGTADTLSEVLALGNTSGGTNIDISPNDVIDFFTGANLNYGRIKADSEGLTIDTVANRHMRFMKAGVETMRINTSGNVGIGTTAPATKFEVVDNSSGGIRLSHANGEYIQMRNSGTVAYLENTTTPLFVNSGADLRLNANNSGADIYLDASGFIKFRESGVDIMAIDGGNVGIGTTSPTEKLTVESGSGFIATFKSLTATDFRPVRWVNSAGANVGFLGNNGSTNTFNLLAQDRPLIFGTGNGAAERMRITSTGFVGIGTTAPSYPFSLENSGSGLISRIYNTNANGQGLLIRAGGSSSATRAFQVASSNDTKIMTVNSNGNVGIGTTAPADLLHIADTSSSNALVTMRAENNLGYAEFGTQSGYSRILSDGYLLYAGTYGATYFYVNASTAMTLNATGLGIGTTAPTYELDVEGSIGINEYLHHNADTDTYLRFLGDRVQLYAGGHSAFDYIEGATSLLYIDQLGQANISLGGNMFLGGSEGNYDGNVGIGTTAPATKIHAVSGSGSGATGDSGYQIIADSSGIAGIQILSSSTQSGRLVFGDSENNSIGILKYDHTDNSMNFNTNSAERMRITSAGNVGIGTTAPQYKLHIVGETLSEDGYRIKISDDTFQRVLSPTGTKSIQFGDAAIDDLKFKNANGNSLVIKSAGNVGIGTTSPNRKLQVVGSSAVSGISTGTSTSPNSAELTANGTNYAAYLLGHSFLSFGTNHLNLGTTAAEKMRITSSGNLLIGTTTDSGQELQVKGSTHVELLLLGNGTTRNSTLNLKNTEQSWKPRLDGGDNDSFVIRDDTNSTEPFKITKGQLSNLLVLSGNNVGIGTTSASEKLEVDGNIKIGADKWYRMGGDAFQIGLDGGGVGMHFHAGSSEKMTLLAGGNLLIGTTTDGGQKLQVNGTASATTFAGDLRGTINTLTTAATQDPLNNSTKVATTAYADNAGISGAYCSFTLLGTQQIAGGGNVGIKNNLIFGTSQVTSSNITASGTGLTFASAGLYSISLNFGTKVITNLNRTLAAANLEYSTDGGESFTAIVGTDVFNYDRGTGTGSSSTGYVNNGSSSCTQLHSIAASSLIRARFWIEGRANSSSGIETLINGCRLSAHKIG